MGRPIRAIFFDLDDTLLDDTISSERSAALVASELVGDRVPADALAIAYMDEAMNFWERLEPGARKPPSGAIRPRLWHATLKRFAIDDEALATRLAHRYDAVRVERVELFPETLPVLHALHGRYKMAIITNGFAETHEAKIARLELSRFFDAVILAGEMQLVKPDPAVFHHAMAELSVTADESVMVGDRFERDVKGAHAAGMRAIWVNTRNEAAPAGALLAEAEIPSIAALPAALAALEAPERSDV
ncbi:MAG: HAD-IA family hydrolase [Candidatus Eremiobacteraeota bacterium]|nr:HAD-IA family hydrolase [Candidatus Eremiobacteraeota bacterium]